VLCAEHLFVAAIQALADEATWLTHIGQRGACSTRCRPAITVGNEVRGPINRLGRHERWQDVNPDEQAVVIRQINGAVNGLQFRVQDLEDTVKALQERLKR
jgi:hypothetical protein